MSNIQCVFLKNSDIPSRAALQASIDALGFDMQLDPQLNLLEDEGFSPNVLEGRADVGIELGRDSVEAILEENSELRDAVGDRDVCITMSWHGSMADLACAMIVSTALAKDFGAVVSHEGDPPDTLAGLLEGTQDAIAEARKET